MGVTECRTWKQLIMQGEHTEETVARVKAEERENKPRSDRSMTRMPEQSSQPEGEIPWRRRLPPFLNPSRLKGINPRTKHVPTDIIRSRMRMLFLSSSCIRRATGSSFLKLDVLKRRKISMIPTTVYIIGCWDTRPRIFTSSKMCSRP